MDVSRFKAVLCAAVTLLLSAFFQTRSEGFGGGIGGTCVNPWVDVDYMLLSGTGMELPPLVTANPGGTPAAEVGVLGARSTRLLLGSEAILDEARSGIRLRSGSWLGATRRIGFEGEYFTMGELTSSFKFDGLSGSFIGRPFINLDPLAGPVRYDSQLIHSPPDQLEGSIYVDAYSEFEGRAFRMRFAAFPLLIGGGGGGGAGCCSTCCDIGCDGCCGGGGAGGGGGGGGAIAGCLWGADVTFGHRYLKLGEGIKIREELFAPGDELSIYDQFDACTQFNGLELGIDVTCLTTFVAANFFGRIALGANENEVNIQGQTINNGVLFNGGVLTQASNIGRDSQTTAALVSELGFNVNFILYGGLSANIGYSAFYWGNVSRASEQIDIRTNPNLFPPATVPVGTIGSQRTNRLSDFFAHGLNVGMAYRF